MARGRPGKGDGETETRDRILQAAEDRFARDGYSGATVRAIAQAAGITPAMIHYYFGSKEKLYHAVLERIARDFEAMAHEIVATGRPPVQRLETYFDWLFDYAARHPNLARLTATATRGAESAYFGRIVRRSFRPLFRLGVGFIEQGTRRRVFRSIDAAHFLTAFYGMVLTYFAEQEFFGMLAGKNPLSRRELEARRRCLKEILFRSLGIEEVPN